MGFFTLQEIRSIGNKIACDVFVRNHRITTDEDEMFRYQETNKKDKEIEPEPDLQVFVIKMRNPEDLEREIRDELKRSKTKKQGRTAAGQNRPNGI